MGRRAVWATTFREADMAKKGITKMEAVRQALAELGNDATRTAIQGFIKDRFGIQMSPDHISNCKSELRNKKKQAGKAKPAAKKPATPKAAAKQPASRPAAATSSPRQAKGDISLPDIEAVKGLVRRVGANQLRELVDLLVK